MTIIKELRIPLPMTVEEYQVGQLYAVAEASKEATTGKTAIEILKNEPFDDPIMGKGQYTHKIYHIAERCPKIVQKVAPSSALKFDEKAWNSFPYCKTGDRFSIVIESMHLPDAGTTENALGADVNVLSKRKVEFLDICTPTEDASLDPTKIGCPKAERGPLEPGWQASVKPIMCCYKLVTIQTRIFGLQGTLESTIEKAQADLLLRFSKQVYCLMNDWYGMSMDDIRLYEERVKQELDDRISGLPVEKSQPTQDQKIDGSSSVPAMDPSNVGKELGV